MGKSSTASAMSVWYTSECTLDLSLLLSVCSLDLMSKPSTIVSKILNGPLFGQCRPSHPSLPLTQLFLSVFRRQSRHMICGHPWAESWSEQSLFCSYSYYFHSLLGWSNRTDSVFGKLGRDSSMSCQEGQYPIGAGARSSCYQLSDFRVGSSSLLTGFRHSYIPHKCSSRCSTRYTTFTNICWHFFWSVLEAFTAGVCDAVTWEPDSGCWMLLVAQNVLFILPTEWTELPMTSLSMTVWNWNL